MFFLLQKILNNYEFTKYTSVGDILKRKVEANWRSFEQNIKSGEVEPDMDRPILGSGLQDKCVNFILYIPLFIYLESIGHSRKAKVRSFSY